jgi:hypothetical protein
MKRKYGCRVAFLSISVVRERKTERYSTVKKEKRLERDNGGKGRD